jgi:hypothetical protein
MSDWLLLLGHKRILSAKERQKQELIVWDRDCEPGKAQGWELGILPVRQLMTVSRSVWSPRQSTAKGDVGTDGGFRDSFHELQASRHLLSCWEKWQDKEVPNQQELECKISH